MTRIVVIFLIFFSPLAICQNYGEWIFADSMHVARQYHSSIVLDNNEILVSGNDFQSTWKTCEIYNRELNGWRYTDSLNIGRVGHKMIQLESGNVIAIG